MRYDHESTTIFLKDQDQYRAHKPTKHNQIYDRNHRLMERPELNVTINFACREYMELVHGMTGKHRRCTSAQRAELWSAITKGTPFEVQHGS